MRAMRVVRHRQPVIANPFASDCFADDSIYANDRDTALSACTASATDDACALTVNGTTTTVTQCQANPFLADCAGGAFDDARETLESTCRALASSCQNDRRVYG